MGAIVSVGRNAIELVKEMSVNVVGAAAPPLARLAELGVARVSFAGFLMNKIYGAHEAKLSEIAAEAAAIA